MFETLVTQPIYNLLILLADIFPGANLGLAIILLTMIIRGLLFPLTFRSLKAQREMKELQPKVNEIKEKYKEDREKMAQELMEVYKNHNVNPFGSCLPLLIQLPIFLGIFRVLQAGDLATVNTDLLYSFVPAPEMLSTVFLGLIDLTVISIPLAIIAAVFQYLQIKISMPAPPAKEAAKSSGALDEDVAAKMQKFTLLLIPGITLIVGSTSLPAGVMLYWIAATVITIILHKLFIAEKKEKEVEVIK